MARPRRQVYTMEQYLKNVKKKYISNDAITQRNPAWESIVDGLAVTILTDDYIPSIILAEEESGQIRIVDGGSRTAAFQMIESGNYKIKKSVDSPIVQYKQMTETENGVIWEIKEFDIRGKSFSQFPEELKEKFYEYQIETVIHENCNKEKVAKYIKRYNEHTGMNANQKAFTYIPRFAEKIRRIMNNKFFLDYSNYTEKEKEKGAIERVIIETVMCMFHLDDWKKTGKDISSFVNDSSSDEEFNKLESNIKRLESIITDETKELFNVKDSMVWFALFNKFQEIGIEDKIFGDFLLEFKKKLHNVKVGSVTFDELTKEGHSKNRAIIGNKIDLLFTLLKDFLFISDNDLDKVDAVTFLKENIEEIIDSDVEEIQMVANDISECLSSESWILSEENYPAYLSLVGIAFRDEVEDILKEWLPIYESNFSFIVNQKKAFIHMKEQFYLFLDSQKKTA